MIKKFHDSKKRKKETLIRRIFPSRNTPLIYEAKRHDGPSTFPSDETLISYVCLKKP